MADAFDGIKYFTRDELKCPHCGECHMKPEFLVRIDTLRERFGKPLIVSSGYRCPEYNAMISHTGTTGPHTTGQAVDIVISGRDAYDLLSLALQMGFTGIGINQKGDYGKRFIHLDTLKGDTRPWVWTY